MAWATLPSCLIVVLALFLIAARVQRGRLQRRECTACNCESVITPASYTFSAAFKKNNARWSVFIGGSLEDGQERWNFVGDIPVRCLKYLPNEDWLLKFSS